MKIFIKQFLYLLVICFVLTSCESEYSRTVKKEIKSGVIYEDLILGMKLGETRKGFYDKCWKLNKEQKVAQGPGNKYAKFTTVLDSTEENSDKVEMLFYGIFDDEKVMHGMEMKFSYIKWAPWNKDFQSDVLIANLQKKYLKEYPGNSFIEITVKDDLKAYAKVDGNRQILMYPLSDKDVMVKMTDLRHSQNIKSIK